MVMVVAAAAFAFFVIMMVAAAAFAFFMIVMVAAAAFAFFMVMVVTTAAFALFMIVMVAAAAFAFFVIMMVAAAAFAFFVIMMVAAAAFAFFMVMMVAAAAFAFFMVMVVAAAAFALFMVMVVTAAAFILFVIMMMPAAAFAVMVVMMAAAAVRLEANRIERLLSLRDFQADHFQHLRQIRQRQHGKSFGRLGNFNAAIDKRSNGLAHDSHVTRHLQHLFNSRAHHPEAALIVDEEVVHMQRTHGFNCHRHFALHRLNSLRHRGALRRSKSDLMRLVENSLSGRRLRRQKLGKGSHVVKIPKGASPAASEAGRRSFSKSKMQRV